MRIAVLGGTGPQGRGLGSRFLRAGHAVRIGSRDAGRAAAAADELRARFGVHGSVEGATNLEVVADSDLVILSVPHAGQASLLEPLAGRLADRIVVSCVNPIGFDEQGPYSIEVPEGSAAQRAARLLPRSRMVAAFHHLSATTLRAEGPPHDETVLVCGDDPEARDTVIGLAACTAGRGGVDAGPLRNARQIEALTAVLLSINRAYKRTSGIAISGL